MIDDDVLTQTTCPLEELEPEREYPDANPKTRFGLEKVPLRLVPPSAIEAEAWAFQHGAEKYGPFNWRLDAVSAATYYEAALRHLHAWYNGEDLDQDSRRKHLGHARACLGILIDAEAYEKLIDNRPNTRPDLLR